MALPHAAIARGIDTVLDRSVVLGYSKLGLALAARAADLARRPRRRTRCRARTSSSPVPRPDSAPPPRQGLARLGARVHLLVRDIDKGEKVRAELAARSSRRRSFELWRCDVSDLDDVRRFATDFADALAQRGSGLAGLVHNAGAMPPERTESAQGHELSDGRARPRARCS